MTRFSPKSAGQAPLGVFVVLLGLALVAPTGAQVPYDAVIVSFSPTQDGGVVTIDGTTEPTDFPFGRRLVIEGSRATGVTVRSRYDPITAGSGCGQESSTVVTCPRAQALLATMGASGDSLRNRTDLVADLSGGGGEDSLQGGPRDDTLSGGPGIDRLVGGAGDDIERGGAGDDLLGSARGTDAARDDPGRDTFDGGDGADIVHAADGFEDKRIDCGPPPFVRAWSGASRVLGERATIDLVDRPPSCEAVQRGAADQHPLVQVLPSAGLVRGRRVAVRLQCPNNAAGPRCAGVVSVIQRRRTLARERYRLSRFAGVRTFALLMRARALGTARVVTRERDMRGKPETTHTMVRLRR
jgi:hypothetical protein